MNANDDVKIEGTQTPQLMRKAQRCLSCGTFMQTIGDRCQTCLEQIWWKEALEQQRVLLAEGRKPIVIYDAGNHPHAALIGRPTMAFCGRKLPAADNRSKPAPPAKELAVMCEQCLEKLRSLMAKEPHQCP